MVKLWDEYGVRVGTRIISSKERTARKAHVCNCCKKPIEPGTKYWEIVTVCEGKFFRDYSHNASGSCWTGPELSPKEIDRFTWGM